MSPLPDFDQPFEGALNRRSFLRLTGGVSVLSVLGMPRELRASESPHPRTALASTRARDLWAKNESGFARETFAPEIPSHGAGLYLLNPR